MKTASEQAIGLTIDSGRVPFAEATGDRVVVNRVASRLGHPASIPRAYNCARSNKLLRCCGSRCQYEWAGSVFGADGQGRPLPGGTTTIVYDLLRQRRGAEYLSLIGTVVNCAGGATPWGSWLSDEESVLKPGETQRSHGWIFEVPARQHGLTTPVPLTAMGPFRHEVAAVDPRTGIVSLTENRDDDLFYRFTPNTPGMLARGRRLQTLGFREQTDGSDSRNWSGTVFAPGSARHARWIDLDEVESLEDNLRHRGHAAGATLFARGEGIHFGAGELYFTCASGGAAKGGQIMRYVPSAERGGWTRRRRRGCSTSCLYTLSKLNQSHCCGT